jgi:AraC-like DNA-binding protein
MDEHLHLPRAQRLIWRWLDAHPGMRPRVADMARMAGVSELELRRGLRHDHASTCRAMITYGCMTYAARLIADGMKVEAAMSLAGYRNKTVFCRNCRDYLGCQPHELRGRSINPLIGCVW